MGGSASLFALSLTERPDGPGNDWLWVIQYFGTLIPYLLMVSLFFKTLGGGIKASEILLSQSTGRGRLEA
jgi:hypothetical protein